MTLGEIEKLLGKEGFLMVSDETDVLSYGWRQFERREKGSDEIEIVRTGLVTNEEVSNA
jgi:hypothetical protein